MLRKLALAVAIAALSGQVIAYGLAARQDVKEVVELKDGSTLYIFRDGKMAVENPYGRPILVRPNTELETKDGKTYMIQSSEVGRLDNLKAEETGY